MFSYRGRLCRVKLPGKCEDDESVNAPPSALRRSNRKRTERRFSFPPCGQAGGSRPSKRKL